jgi:hypothetical protein
MEAPFLSTDYADYTDEEEEEFAEDHRFASASLDRRPPATGIQNL